MYLLCAQFCLLVAILFDCLTKFACINEYWFIYTRFVDEHHTYIGASVCKDITWHTYHTTQNGLLTIDQVLTYLESDATFSRDETRRHDYSRLTVFFQTVKQMLEEAKVNLHALLVLRRNVWYTGKETSLVTVCFQVVVVVGEVQLERRIADNIVELAQ